jgi:hypothetical protein
LHGLAGRLASAGDVPVSAQDVLLAIPDAFRAVTGLAD